LLLLLLLLMMMMMIHDENLVLFCVLHGLSSSLVIYPILADTA
jgi:hypothetical protein